MITEEHIRELLNPVKDPHIHKTFEETGAIENIKLKEDKNHVSIKIALTEPNSSEQMQLQQEIVGMLKKEGVATVGLRFTELPEEQRKEYLEAANEEKEANLIGQTGTQFISIASGKGGVGKSTVTVNLAIALARLGKKVGIVDADIYGFSVPDMMGIENRPQVRGEKIIPVERFGVQVISMGFFVEDNSPIIWRGPMLGKMLTSFFKEVEWGDLDYLLLDLPPGTGDIALDVQELLPSSKQVIVTTPHPTAAFVAARAGQMAIKAEHELIGIVENMSYFESAITGQREYVFGEGGGDKLAEVLETEVLGRLPLQQPYEEEDVFAPGIYQEDHPTGKIFLSIANKINKRCGK
ncbi:Mrp/NBP35 family ATP-binding protein [Tenuibacillus multivorans]|uniref:Iron-sulfur cluster carrier protein n=1 Tax=Tenuibacillus multivorans TaxID=237069 RepID=A0A1H0FAM4_9BACI|nr:Mrp/NBP35 family ATP-binding protein [Tenuibacillus multivorans]GEL78787.1 iron-sulfur cluster carrier protein [Tenuibacillus multivorans]SDN91694.1 ATP-binding protein involved in chromosome partitioning [Tenuibacillus multivorans]